MSRSSSPEAIDHHLEALVGLPPPDVVIAADSGLDHATALGFAVDVIVGDLDSADPAAVDAAVAAGTVVERHPEAKDATDLELALLAARTRGCERVVVVGGHGGRLDHFLANALLLASPELADLQVEARLGDARGVRRARATTSSTARSATSARCCPSAGRASGVRTEGLRFPLCRETLEPGSTRGVSNEFLGTGRSASRSTTACCSRSSSPRTKRRTGEAAASRSCCSWPCSRPRSRRLPGDRAPAPRRPRRSRSSPTTRSRCRGRCWPPSRSRRA